MKIKIPSSSKIYTALSLPLLFLESTKEDEPHHWQFLLAYLAFQNLVGYPKAASGLAKLVCMGGQKVSPVYCCFVLFLKETFTVSTIIPNKGGRSPMVKGC